MLSGAGKEALFVFGLRLALYALYLVSLLLPPESKLAPSRHPRELEAPLVAVQVG
jgi:hypothetical protein